MSGGQADGHTSGDLTAGDLRRDQDAVVPAAMTGWAVELVSVRGVTIRCRSGVVWVRMKIVAAIHSSEAIRKIPDCRGLPVRAPPIAKPSPDRPIEEPIIF
jgi:hypothetical protein